MKKVKVNDAVGMVLGHDITKIIPEKFKGRAFKKGHIITKEDIPELLKIGKEHIYIMHLKQGEIHENEAALRLAKAGGKKGITFTEPKEGRVNLKAQYSGVLKVNKDLLKKINTIENIMFASLHNNKPVNSGEMVAGTRIIPLVIDEKPIKYIEELCQKEVLIEVRPYQKYKVGIVITGNEVYYGRVKDAFGAVLRKKLKPYGCEIIGQKIVPDSREIIQKTIEELIKQGAQIILTTGGMSVDPDDVTPSAIRKLGTDIVSYGAPVLPGAMFLFGYLGETVIMGLPGCVMYAKTTVFDLILPRVLIGERITKEHIANLGHGGLCLSCKHCYYPNCGFGKGV
ncbi:molybdenum cofactor synthesis domain-containing protein [Desulfohalotomaculum tongense]|uniref:molybdopterin-binding protein n=1 Tax=Desulforadius tongensis TaxID=1216062 RepID=UPI00195663A3|nr:molybdopterin-binding protein [Desulforadius tongensis]MBM7854114.1 molybdenum cofactor synthesis domain-containing protein [Desulforadius tongensis]